MRRLNWGSSFDVAPGWTNSDRNAHGQEHVGDLLDGLPFPDGYFDYAVSHHALQMFDYQELPAAVRELRRVLKAGRPLRISVPDPLKAFEAYQRGDSGSLVIPDEVESTIDGKFVAYLTWYGTNKTLFTFGFIHDLFIRNGWSKVLECGYQDTTTDIEGITELDSRPNESLWVEAYR